MRKVVSLFPLLSALVALQTTLATVSLAADGEPAAQEGLKGWIPSFAIVSGATIQNQDGYANSFQFEDMSPVPTPLRGEVDGDDLAASPFVGGALELTSPALPIPTRPRFFLSGEVLPTFASDRDVALEGDPDCVRGPEPGVPCARDEGTSRTRAFGEDSINGDGSRTSSQVDTWVFGARLGAAFPFEFRKRQLRIKPSVGWLSYEVEASGLVIDGSCLPTTRCTNVYSAAGDLLAVGFLREVALTGSESRRFHGIGPGLELEMDAVRYGPLGISLFVGAGAYAILGDRSISFSATQSYDDVLGDDTAQADFEVEVDPWMYRANLGVRFHWLGSGG
jgi:hypothetical protein